MTVFAAEPIAPQFPTWLNSPFIIGVLIAILTVIMLWGLIKMAPTAHQQKTGNLASSGMNYLIILLLAVLIIGGGFFGIAQSTIDQVFTQ